MLFRFSIKIWSYSKISLDKKIPNKYLKSEWRNINLPVHLAKSELMCKLRFQLWYIYGLLH